MEAGGVEGFLAGVAREQEGVEAFRARFEQEKHIEIVRDVVRSSGTILVARERGMVWTIDAPERARLAVLPSGIFVDGEKIREAPGGGGSLPLGRLSRLFAGLSPEITEDFDVERLGEAKLRLTPRHEALAGVVREVELTLGSERRLPTRIKFEETTGDTTDIRLSEIEINPSLAPEALGP